MNYKIVIIDEAKIDFKETLIWYKNRDPKLAKKVLSLIQRKSCNHKKESISFSNTI